MKFFIFFIFLFNPLVAFSKTCKIQILQSFGYEGRITPNRVNSLCPKVTQNCCTDNDLMKMHKQWNLYYKVIFDRKKLLYRNSWQKISTMIDLTKDFDLDHLNRQFESFTKISITPEYQIHLTKLQKEFNKMNPLTMQIVYKSLTDYGNGRLSQETENLRQNTLCMLCDYRAQQQIDTIGKTITFSPAFCTKLAFYYLPFLQQKFEQIYKKFVILDEWVFLTSGMRIIEDESDRVTLKRYLDVIKKCDKGKCEELCSEFNPNRYVYMFDGEQQLIKKIRKQLRKIADEIDKSEKDFFKRLERSWDRTNIEEFITTESVLSPVLATNPNLSPIPATTNSYFNNPPKIFVEPESDFGDVQVETLDVSLDNFQLYKQAEPPVKIDTFLILFGKELNEGINLYLIGLKTNFLLQSHQLLGLLHNKSVNLDLMDEIIESHILRISHEIDVTDIIEFQTDWQAEYKTMKDPMNSKLNLSSFYMFQPRISFMTKTKKKLWRWLLKNPPYGHPIYSPEKALQYADQLTYQMIGFLKSQLRLTKYEVLEILLIGFMFSNSSIFSNSAVDIFFQFNPLLFNFLFNFVNILPKASFFCFI